MQAAIFVRFSLSHETASFSCSCLYDCCLLEIVMLSLTCKPPMSVQRTEERKAGHNRQILEALRSRLRPNLARARMQSLPPITHVHEEEGAGQKGAFHY